MAMDICRLEAVESRPKVRIRSETFCGLIEVNKKGQAKFHKGIQFVKENIRNELERRKHGALVRSPDMKVELRAQPSKLFRAFERQRAAPKTLPRLNILAIFRPEVGKLI